MIDRSIIDLDMAICDFCAQEKKIHSRISALINDERKRQYIKHNLPLNTSVIFRDEQGNNILDVMRKRLELLHKELCMVIKDEDSGVVVTICKKHILEYLECM